MTVPSIEDVIGALPAWAGRRVIASPIAGGLTNRNFRVEVDGVPTFVRIPGAGTDLLAVDRANEVHNTRAAAAAGVGARVLHHLPAWDVVVLEWIDARTMSNAAFQAPGEPTRIADALRRLHAGPRFRDDFDMVALSRRYLRVIEERSIAVPDGYREHLGAVPRIDAALRARPLSSVPCHNDLLAENYLDDGDRLWIVDYEYSGNNDPSFELGNTAQELGFDGGRLRELIAAYFGEATPALEARCRLQMIMSDVGWTLWAAIQSRISNIDYDFWGWAVERWTRAQAMIDGPDFEDWLAATHGMAR
ncbi:MAG TPA: phosphotransferase [Candidatus Sulfomarinibacteraceae bacterium]|nr:phosphotransferase [Candidatus Sulfomarinibacteraceae bacterium]